MTVIFQPDDQAQQARLNQYAQADAYRAQAVNTNEIALLNSFSAAYPTADPSVIAGLARTGRQPNDPVVQKIMMQHTQQQQKGGWFNKIGDVISNAASDVGKAAGFVAGSTASGIAGIGKGVVRAGLVAVETPFQEAQDFERATIYTGLNPVVGTTPGMMGQSFGSALQQSGSSSGVDIINKLLTGDAGNIDLGTGFLPSGRIEQNVKTEASRLSLTLPNAQFGPGHQAITGGRVVAGTVFHQGTTPYNILSGLIDGAIAWYGDPTAALGSAAADAEVGARIGRAIPVALDEGIGAGVHELGIRPSLSASVSHTSQGAAARSAAENVLGMLTGHRNTTIPELSETALSKGGQRIIQHIADEPNARTLYEAMGRKVPIPVANELAKANTTQDVLQVLNSHVGNEITQFPQWNGITVKAMGEPSSRLWSMMPGKKMDPNNLEDVYTKTARMLTTMKASPEMTDKVLSSIMTAPDAASVAPLYFKGIGEAADEMATRLRVNTDFAESASDFASRTGLTPNAGESTAEFAQRATDAQILAAKKVKASGLVRSFAADGEKARAYLGDEITRNDMAAGLAVDGELIPSQAPYQLLEFLNTGIPMPDVRDLRRATSTLGRLVDNPLWEQAAHGADWLMGKWKPLTIIKPALATKLIGEHQAEMAAAGFDSFFSHPTSFVASVVANPAKAQEFMDSVREAGPIGGALKVARHPFQAVEAVGSKAAAPFIGQIRQGNALAEPWVNTAGENALKDLMGSMTNDVSDLAGVGGAGVKGQRLFTLQDGPAAYNRAWHNSLSDIYRDEVWRKVAENEGNLDTVKRWFSVGEGAKFREQLAARLPLLDSPAGSDAYIDSLHRSLMYRTGGDAKTLEAVSTGMFDGAPMGQLDDAGKWSLSDAFKQHLTNVSGPDSVKGSVTIAGEHPQKALFDDTMTYLFDHLLGEPFDKLVSHPVYAQAYWQDGEKMLPFMDAATRSQFLENAAKEGIGPGRKVVARMRDTPMVAHPTVTNLEDAHLLLSKRALDATKKVLYDQVNKSQFFDAMRTVFPFGEAWRQALTRWSKIAINNPNTIVGGQKIVTAAMGNRYDGTVLKRDPVTGVPTSWSGTGFFHKDQNGDEVFNIPFGRNISKMALGLSVPLLSGGTQSSNGASLDLTSKASGLSALMDVLPGVGPVWQLGAGAILPNTPDWDWARNFISPHGVTDTSGGILESVLPSPLKTLKQLFQSANYDPNSPHDAATQKLYASYVGDASNYVVSTGKFDMTDPTGVEQSNALADAQSIAKGMLVLHMFGQALAPSSPSLESLAKVKAQHNPALDKMPGILTPGNLVLENRPVVTNKDGSISTVRTITVTDDNGHAVLLPTVIGDKVVSNDEAIEHWQQTGEHLGVFDNEKNADAYAEALHKDQENMYSGKAVGHLVEQAMLAKELTDMEQDPKIGYDNAVETFIQRYGEQAFTATQGKTISLVGQAPLGTASSDWARNNSGLVKDFPLAWSLFAPQDSPDSFDYSAYQRQINSGQRQNLTAAQRIALAQIHLASHQYAIAQAKLPPNPTAADRTWLGQVRQLLQEEYPAYGEDVPGLPAKYSPDTVIAQVARAVVDPRVSKTKVAQAAQLYLEARQQAITAAQALKGSSAGPVTGPSASGKVLSGRGAEGIQAWLMNIGNLLVQQNPDFGSFFDSVFARELT